jgi:hypothetical protein
MRNHRWTQSREQGGSHGVSSRGYNHFDKGCMQASALAPGGMGRFLEESSYCRQPDSGNPTVRDERGACGNVSYGGIRNPPHNRKDASRKLFTYGCARRISTRRPESDTKPRELGILGKCRSLTGRRRPSGEHDTDECGTDTPGSQTASSCPTTVDNPRRATNQELLGHQP